MKRHKKHKKPCCNKKNILIVGLLFFAVIIVIVFSFLVRQRTNQQNTKANTDLCSVSWQCLGVTADETVKHLFGCNMYKWMNEHANQVHYQYPYENQTGWYCLDECADQSVVSTFGGNRQRWMTEKTATKSLISQDCLSYLDTREKIRIETLNPTVIYTGKITGRQFTCAFSEIAKDDSTKTVCFGGVAQDPTKLSGFNQNCIWDPSTSETVDCPGQEQKLTTTKAQIIVEKQNTKQTKPSTINQVSKITSLVVIGDSLSYSQADFSYHQILKKHYGIENVKVFAQIGAQTGKYGMKGWLDEVLTNGNHFDYAIVFGGVNDLASGVSFSTIKDNLQNIYTRLHQAGIKVIAITVLPWKDYQPVASIYTKVEETKSLNNWISKQAKDVDIVINAYDLLNDPNNSGALKNNYDWGDGLHYSPAGQAALADLIIDQL